MRDRDTTPYGFPPEGDPFQKLPPAIPWDEPISNLSGFWIDTGCGACGRSAALPLRLLAAQLGWNRTLRDIVPSLKCEICKSTPSIAYLVDKPTGDKGRFGAKMQKLDLLTLRE